MSQAQPPFPPHIPRAIAYIYSGAHLSFINRYKEKVKDYNFGSLIRTDARQEYGETNTIFGASHSLYFVLGKRNFESKEMLL